MNPYMSDQSGGALLKSTPVTLKKWSLGIKKSKLQLAQSAATPTPLTTLKEAFPSTTKVIQQSQEEIRDKVDQVVSFTISNIVMNGFRAWFMFWWIIFAMPYTFLSWLKAKLTWRHQPRCSCRCHSIKKKQTKKQLSIITKETSIPTKRLQVVLDLDNTLIHSVKKEPAPGDPQSFVIQDFMQIASGDKIHVYKRPYLDQFLSELSKFADVHLFTASQKEYADQIIQVIDPCSLIFRKRFYREDCSKDLVSKTIFKRLEVVDEDMTNLLMIDDSHITYEKNQLNTFQIQHWRMTQREDSCLRACLILIQQIHFGENRNVQEALPELQNFNKLWLPYHY